MLPAPGSHPDGQNHVQPQEQIPGDRLAGVTTAEYLDQTLPDGTRRVIPVSVSVSRTTDQGEVLDQTTRSVIYGPDGRPLTAENLQAAALSWSGVYLPPGAPTAACASAFHHGPNRTIAVGQDGLLRPDGTGLCRECLATRRCLGAGAVIVALGVIWGLLKAAAWF